MINKKFYYRLNQFFPNNNDLGGYGFGIDLSKEFARGAFEFTPETTEILQEKGKRLIKRVMGIDFRNPYVFFRREGEETGLVQICRVPGNATKISLGPIDRVKKALYKDENYNFLTYHPHNVDSSHQACVLTSLWCRWSETLEASLID